jgi:AcrR family transcriptional regulator
MSAVIVRARDRRVLGPRGAATRDTVLRAVAEHLAATPWHRASVPALARDGGTTAGTFYQYFADLEDAVRELRDRARQAGAVPEHLARIVELLDWEARHLPEDAP